MKRADCYGLSLALLMSTAAVASPPNNSWLQLNKLNQANRQNLQRLQEAYTRRQPSAVIPIERLKRQPLNQQQQLQQQGLQRSQLHQQLIQDRRIRTTPPERSRRLEGLFRLQRFRQDQQRQLQRFEHQQQMHRWSR
jgi:hypothetical protein